MPFWKPYNFAIDKFQCRLILSILNITNDLPLSASLDVLGIDILTKELTFFCFCMA